MGTPSSTSMAWTMVFSTRSIKFWNASGTYKDQKTQLQNTYILLVRPVQVDFWSYRYICSKEVGFPKGPSELCLSQHENKIFFFQKFWISFLNLTKNQLVIL